jgi:hypothetical protein
MVAATTISDGRKRRRKSRPGVGGDHASKASGKAEGVLRTIDELPRGVPFGGSRTGLLICPTALSFLRNASLTERRMVSVPRRVEGGRE